MSGLSQSELPIVPDDSTDRPRSFGQAVRVAALCFAATFSLYVLSAGPMSGLARVLELPSFQSAVQVVYFPLYVIVKKDVRPFSTALRWYAGLFR